MYSSPMLYSNSHSIRSGGGKGDAEQSPSSVSAATEPLSPASLGIRGSSLVTNTNTATFLLAASLSDRDEEDNGAPRERIRRGLHSSSSGIHNNTNARSINSSSRRTRRRQSSSSASPEKYSLFSSVAIQLQNHNDAVISDALQAIEMNNNNNNNTNTSSQPQNSPTPPNAAVNTSGGGPHYPPNRSAGPSPLLLTSNDALASTQRGNGMVMMKRTASMRRSPSTANNPSSPGAVVVGAAPPSPILQKAREGGGKKKMKRSSRHREKKMRGEGGSADDFDRAPSATMPHSAGRGEGSDEHSGSIVPGSRTRSWQGNGSAEKNNKSRRGGSTNKAAPFGRSDSSIVHQQRRHSLSISSAQSDGSTSSSGGSSSWGEEDDHSSASSDDDNAVEAFQHSQDFNAPPPALNLSAEEDENNGEANPRKAITDGNAVVAQKNHKPQQQSTPQFDIPEHLTRHQKARLRIKLQAAERQREAERQTERTRAKTQLVEAKKAMAEKVRSNVIAQVWWTVFTLTNSTAKIHEVIVKKKAMLFLAFRMLPRVRIKVRRLRCAKEISSRRPELEENEGNGKKPLKRPTLPMLRSDDVLRLFPDSLLLDLIPKMEPRFYFRGDIIFYQGASGSEAFVIGEGEVIFKTIQHGDDVFAPHNASTGGGLLLGNNFNNTNNSGNQSITSSSATGSPSLYPSASSGGVNIRQGIGFHTTSSSVVQHGNGGGGLSRSDSLMALGGGGSLQRKPSAVQFVQQQENQNQQQQQHNGGGGGGSYTLTASGRFGGGGHSEPAPLASAGDLLQCTPTFAVFEDQPHCLTEGSVFGANGMISGEKRSATYRAATDVVVWVVQHSDFEAAIANNNQKQVLQRALGMVRAIHCANIQKLHNKALTPEGLQKFEIFTKVDRPILRAIGLLALQKRAESAAGSRATSYAAGGGASRGGHYHANNNPTLQFSPAAAISTSHMNDSSAAAIPFSASGTTEIRRNSASITSAFGRGGLDDADDAPTPAGAGEFVDSKGTSVSDTAITIQVIGGGGSNNGVLKRSNQNDRGGGGNDALPLQLFDDEAREKPRPTTVDVADEDFPEPLIFQSQQAMTTPNMRPTDSYLVLGGIVEVAVEVPAYAKFSHALFFVLRHFVDAVHSTRRTVMLSLYDRVAAAVEQCFKPNEGPYTVTIKDVGSPLLVGISNMIMGNHHGPVKVTASTSCDAIRLPREAIIRELLKDFYSLPGIQHYIRRRRLSFFPYWYLRATHCARSEPVRMLPKREVHRQLMNTISGGGASHGSSAAALGCGSGGGASANSPSASQRLITAVSAGAGGLTNASSPHRGGQGQQQQQPSAATSPTAAAATAAGTQRNSFPSSSAAAVRQNSVFKAMPSLFQFSVNANLASGGANSLDGTTNNGRTQTTPLLGPSGSATKPSAGGPLVPPSTMAAASAASPPLPPRPQSPNASHSGGAVFSPVEQFPNGVDDFSIDALNHNIDEAVIVLRGAFGKPIGGVISPRASTDDTLGTQPFMWPPLQQVYYGGYAGCAAKVGGSMTVLRVKRRDIHKALQCELDEANQTAFLRCLKDCAVYENGGVEPQNGPFLPPTGVTGTSSSNSRQVAPPSTVGSPASSRMMGGQQRQTNLGNLRSGGGAGGEVPSSYSPAASVPSSPSTRALQIGISGPPDSPIIGGLTARSPPAGGRSGQVSTTVSSLKKPGGGGGSNNGGPYDASLSLVSGGGDTLVRKVSFSNRLVSSSPPAAGNLLEYPSYAGGFRNTSPSSLYPNTGGNSTSQRQQQQHHHRTRTNSSSLLANGAADASDMESDTFASSVMTSVSGGDSPRSNSPPLTSSNSTSLRKPQQGGGGKGTKETISSDPKAGASSSSSQQQRKKSIGGAAAGRRVFDPSLQLVGSDWDTRYRKREDVDANLTLPERRKKSMVATPPKTILVAVAAMATPTDAVGNGSVVPKSITNSNENTAPPSIVLREGGPMAVAPTSAAAAAAPTLVVTTNAYAPTSKAAAVAVIADTTPAGAKSSIQQWMPRRAVSYAMQGSNSSKKSANSPTRQQNNNNHNHANGNGNGGDRKQSAVVITGDYLASNGVSTTSALLGGRLGGDGVYSYDALSHLLRDHIPTSSPYNINNMAAAQRKAMLEAGEGALPMYDMTDRMEQAPQHPQTNKTINEAAKEMEAKRKAKEKARKIRRQERHEKKRLEKEKEAKLLRELHGEEVAAVLLKRIAEEEAAIGNTSSSDEDDHIRGPNGNRRRSRRAVLGAETANGMFSTEEVREKKNLKRLQPTAEELREAAESANNQHRRTYPSTQTPQGRQENAEAIRKMASDPFYQPKGELASLLCNAVGSVAVRSDWVIDHQTANTKQQRSSSTATTTAPAASSSVVAGGDVTPMKTPKLPSIPSPSTGASPRHPRLSASSAATNIPSALPMAAFSRSSTVGAFALSPSSPAGLGGSSSSPKRKFTAAPPPPPQAMSPTHLNQSPLFVFGKPNSESVLSDTFSSKISPAAFQFKSSGSPNRRKGEGGLVSRAVGNNSTPQTARRAPVTGASSGQTSPRLPAIPPATARGGYLTGR